MVNSASNLLFGPQVDARIHLERKFNDKSERESVGVFNRVVSWCESDGAGANLVLHG